MVALRFRTGGSNSPGVFKKAATGAEIEEERRLFYVAMTRARKELYICGIRKDDFGKKESRFLHELPGRTAVQG